MTNHDDRRRDALDLLVSNLEQDVERVRARIGSLVADVVGDARNLADWHESDGPESVNPTFLEMHTRALVAAKAELAEKRDRLRELKNVIEFADSRS